MQQMPVIHVVDDDEPFQVAVTRLLNAAGYQVRGYVNAGDFLLARFEEGPGCILLDLHMPGPSGLDLQEALALRIDPLPVIFLSGRGDVPSAVRAVKAGAVDFLTKPVKREILLSAILNALARDAARRAVHEQSKSWRACYDTLTARELEVFERVVTGKLNKQIADELGASERTVKTYRAQVMQKMHADSVAQLVQIAGQLRSSQPLPPDQRLHA